MKECDILGGSKHTLTPPTYCQGRQDSHNPPGSMPHALPRGGGRREGTVHLHAREHRAQLLELMRRRQSFQTQVGQLHVLLV